MRPATFCIHGHFYQPPRADPFTGKVPREPDAAPYANWNERITAECYAPLARRELFRRISFNLGATLARWLDEYAHDTYERIVADERAVYQAHGVGNGLAQSVHHTILPLARRRDKICQIRWGIASFTHRFGHPPEGMWLPEMAVDLETLEVLAAEGVRFTILSDQQVRGDLTDGAGPYRVRLPGGREIAVFVRDRALSDALAFGMPAPENTEQWLREHLEWRCRRGGLVLIATDGETFGHHHPQGIDVLERILDGVEAVGCSPVTLGPYFREHPPRAEVEVVENSAWSCEHNLYRWALGCPCTPGDGRWKAALRRALDNLTSELDEVYACEAQRLGLAPWPLRDAYIAVVLGQVDGERFLCGNGLGHLTTDQARRLLWLLEAQFYRQRMYASCTFFFEDLDRHEPRYAIANAVRALALVRYATGDDLTAGFRRDLRLAVSWRTGRSGADILDEMLR
jgi:alpha-amylase/alpha-mannosidase (GH57 family)